jgi:asparagine synthase (glutamine-hydrolysing)
MCGIAGWIDWETDLTDQRRVLEAMTETQIPRGPDDSGIWLSRHAALGHRRLIVIDPAGGSQPMVRQYGTRRYVIVYNGELYNTPELRHALTLRGHTFQGHSDTEVLLASYVEWGPSCVERFNGIFAFGIWDESEQRLFLSRDRLGVKPLFYAQRDNALVFGSELKALLAHPEIQPVIDEEGLAEILVIGPARTPGHGVFRGVSELRPGHSLIFHRGGIRIQQYWKLDSQPHTDDLDTTTETIRGMLQDAIERQLVSDVPICTLLSGGLDSSAITAFAAQAMRRQGKGPLHTYSVDYAGNDRHFRINQFQPDADAPWVRMVSDYLETRHHNVVLDTPELADALKAATRARDLPGMTDIDASLLLFCREIKKGATVALSGECADEVFGGYPWFHREDAWNPVSFPWTRNLSERLQLLKPDIYEKIRPEEYMAARYREALSEVPRLPGEEPQEARMREMFYLNLTRWMPTLLDRKDRMSMAAGLEVRVPFCDHRLVEYVWNVPWSMKNHGQKAKGILRRALRGILPDPVLQRPKSPYPKTHNPAYRSACRDWALSILANPDSPLHELVDAHRVRAMAKNCETLDMPWFGQLMNVPQFFAYLGQIDIWMREYRVRIQ